MAENLRSKIDLASPIVARKFTVFALFYFLFLRAISKYEPPGRLRFGGANLTEGFLCYEFDGLYLEGCMYMETIM